MGQQPDQAALMEPVYTVPEMAAALRVSTTKVLRLIGAKKIKAFQVGREYRVKKSDWDDFTASLEDETVEPAVAAAP